MEYIDGGLGDHMIKNPLIHLTSRVLIVANLFIQFILDSADCRRHFVKIL